MTEIKKQYKTESFIKCILKSSKTRKNVNVKVDSGKSKVVRMCQFLPNQHFSSKIPM